MEKLNALSVAGASLMMGAGDHERAPVRGRYIVECFDKDGNKKWDDVVENVVCTAGKNLLLDTVLAGSAYTVVGPYMGLISSVSWSAVAAGDTQVSHAGWTEAGSTNAPDFTARIICAWSAASAGAKALSASLSFTMTSGGTLEGCFIVYGTGAVATLMSTAGTLLSAGAFTGGARTVLTGDTVNVSYSLSI